MAKATDALKPLIREAIKEERKKPPLEADSWIRISGVSYLCAREEVLCAREVVERTDDVEADLSLVFEHGNALHWVLQNRILPATKTLYGRWLCGECGTRHGGRDEWMDEDMDAFEAEQIPRPEKCPECSAELTSDNSLYVEQHIRSARHGLQGHPDGFLRLEGMPGFGVLEVKSISSKGAWEVRGCAKLDHVTQAQCYMWRTGCRWGLIVYWDKGAFGMKALIIHIVEYDEDHVEAIQNLIRDIRAGIADPESKLPDRICGSSDCKRANLCDVSEQCFEAE